MKTIIKNATTLPQLLNHSQEGLINVNLVIVNNKIEKVSQADIFGSFDLEIDANGLFLSPGLIDPQVHFREPGMEYKEDIVSGSKAAVKGGFTSVISMPNTAPTADNPDTVKYMKDKSDSIGICKVYPTGAVSYGLEGSKLTDFEALKQAGAVAVTDDGKGIQSDELFAQAMQAAKQAGLALLDHSEDESLSQGGAIHQGSVAQSHGVKGIRPKSESEHVKRGCRLSAETGAHYHVLHVSTAASIDHVRHAKKDGLNVTVEVSPHHLLLCDEDIKVKPDGSLDANWKMNPPLRSKADMLACREALIDGTIDAIATDHAPHSPEEKALPIEQAPFGIIGLETAFPLMYTHFVKTGHLSLERLIDLMSKQAGALFNIEAGRLLEGRIADLVLFDLNTSFTLTESYFASKSSNSPFIGETLFGATHTTFVDGRIVYQSK